MKEEKVKLDLKSKENKIIRFQGRKISIKPYISLDEKSMIMEKIHESYKTRIEESQGLIPIVGGIIADLDFIIVAITTNLNLDGIDFNNLICSGLLDIIKNNIINYNDIRQSVIDMITIFKIELMIPDMSELTNSFNFEELVKGKSTEEIGQITNMVEELIKKSEG